VKEDLPLFDEGCEKQGGVRMKRIIDNAISAVEQRLLGKSNEVRLAFACLLSGGHLLLEDLPGMGKTTLAHALAEVMGLSYSRVQFTSDLLPADILGVSVYQREAEAFRFQPGPIFNQVLLADEINRATPRAQSALLEAMSEGQVSIDGVTHSLPTPFFVIATQNPIHQTGTYPLPESQLDRFLMRLSLGYPGVEAERALLLRDQTTPRDVPQAAVDATAFEEVRAMANQVHVSPSVLGFIERIIACTRESAEFAMGLSPRGAIALVSAARTWALMADRDYLLPEDVQAVLRPVVCHRLVPSADYAGDSDALVDLVAQRVDVIPD
jgi:MoxR-like ATPase